MEMEKYYRVRAEVNLNAIRHNIQALQNNLPERTKTCMVIKADGYGHGAVHLAQHVEDLADFFAVATIEEGLELRSAKITAPILVLGYVHPSMTSIAAKNRIRLTVFDPEQAKQISQLAVLSGCTVQVHIKIDTGMGRIGFPPQAPSAAVIRQIMDLEGMEIEGIFTHFANADDRTGDDAMRQLSRFQSFLQILKEQGIEIPIRHCANSAAATYLREADMDMVRLGISVYGLYPSRYIRQIPLEPAMTLKSHVVMVKKVQPGMSVGYGSIWTAEKESVIATVPVGYADGYYRSLSNKGYVLIRGRKYPVAGRVCMDQIMVDVTGEEEIREGDEVVLVGESCGQVITMEEIAELAGSFNYEFACGLSRRIPRIYYLDGECVGVKNPFEAFYACEMPNCEDPVK